MARIRIGLGQLNVTVGDIDGNVRAITEALGSARSAAADFIAFPELAVCGYPPEDLLLKPAFVAANRQAVETLARQTRGITAVVGFADRDVDLYNAAAVLHDGTWVGTYHKQRLPNYGVFDELRYFRPARHGELLLRLGGASVGISICEDIWLPGGPVGRLARAGAEIIVNINASPYQRGKWRARHTMLATRASDHGVMLAYVNLVGGQDELVFDGGSVVFGPSGELIAEAPMHQEHLLFCDVELEQVFRARLHDPRRRHLSGAAPRSVRRLVLSEDTPSQTRPPIPAAPERRHDDIGEVYGALVLGVRDYVRKNRFSKVVLGLSGGIDSALVAAIAADALGAGCVTGVLLPSRYSSEHSRADAQALANAFGIETLELPIEPVFTAALETLRATFSGMQPGIAEENLQARIRGLLLMALSNKFGWLLLSTGNKSELATGYSTLYGDMAGGFAVLKDVPKSLVYELARWRNARAGHDAIPRSTIEKPPSAELRPEQKDSDSLPPYEQLDPILQKYVEEDWSAQELIAAGHDETLVRTVVHLVDSTEYKRRQAAPGVKITPRAFGKDRRLPMTNGFRSR
ncbi:MAG TPA: NAD+ synthase [Longimicrobiales bacterium]|nr:NAD+ synthase [Longimicrobiales bacterium]